MNRTVKYQGAFSRIVGFAGKRFLFSSPPPPSIFFFCSRSNFRAITRLETLATQAMTVVGYEPLQIYNRTPVSILGKVSFCHQARRELKLGIQNAGFLRWLDWIFWGVIPPKFEH